MDITQLMVCRLFNNYNLYLSRMGLNIMDQIKIGKFIAECRKKNNLTQMQLAEKLNITDRIELYLNGKMENQCLIHQL